MIEALRILLGSAIALFVPGFALSWVFFPRKAEIDWLERIALSFGLSIAIIPLTVFYSNHLFGVEINIQNVTLIATAITIIGYLGHVERTKKALSKHIRKKALSEPPISQHLKKRKSSKDAKNERGTT